MIESSLLALRRLVEHYPDLRLTILGGLSTPGDRRWLRRTIEELSLLNHAAAMPYVSDEELGKIYRSAYALLAPLEDTSQNQSRFPNKIAEYLASGRPVITNAVGDIPLYLQHGRDAYFLAKADPATIAEGVAALLRDRSLADRIGSGGLLTASRCFDFRGHSAQLAGFLEGIASTASRGSTARGKRPRLKG